MKSRDFSSKTVYRDFSSKSPHNSSDKTNNTIANDETKITNKDKTVSELRNGMYDSARNSASIGDRVDQGDLDLRKDFYRFNKIIQMGKNGKQKSFLQTACVRWYINQQKRRNRPKLMIDDLEFFNKQNANNKFEIEQMIQAEKQIDHYLKSKSANELGSPFPVRITDKQRQRAREMYSGNSLDQDLCTLLKIYRMVGDNNTQLSMPPIFEGTECFGSPLNTHNQKYCSPFEIEKKFGSLGSFFDYVPKLIKKKEPELLLCNPPFDEDLMAEMADVLIKVVRERSNVGAIIVIPVWDNETQKQLGIKQYGAPFECLEKLKQSGLIKEHLVLDKDKYKYYDYYKDRKAPVTYTHLILLGNGPSLSEIETKWADYSMHS